MTRLALLLAVAALLAPAGASAKELVAATVCGASGCRTVTDRAMLNEIPGGEEVTGLGAPAAYYRLNVVTAEPSGRRQRFTTYYVPSANAMSWSEDGLYRLHPIHGAKANGVMRRITEGIEPYAAPRVTTAIDLRSSRPSPWTEGKAGRTLRAETSREIPWTWIGIAAGLLLLAAVLASTGGRPWRPPSRAAATERSAG